MHRPFAVVFLMLVSGFPAGTAAQSQGARAGPFLKEPAFAELSASRAEAAIHEYIQATRGWDRSGYRLERSGKRRVPVVYVVTYLVETREFIDSGRVFEVHLDAESGRVVGESPVPRTGGTKDLQQAVMD
ncbi:MAG: hypothetical protein J0L89_09785 [Xanthomonadales bacterium]|nr:hypothetical protein [Xanthomonadales bacterium]HRF83997.1 hypothetical protein [Pseudoxanthomonas sp.]